MNLSTPIPTTIVRGLLLRALACALLACALWAPAAAAVADVPEVVRELIERGEARRAQGQLDDALAAYQEARKLGPEVVEIYVALGGIYHQQGQLEAAREAFAAGIAISPQDRSLLYNGAVVALNLGRLEEGRGWIGQAVAAHPKDAELYLLQAAILDRLEEKKSALDALLQAEKLRPGDAQVQFRLGNLYYAVGRSEDAVDAYQRALRKDPSLLRAQYNLGAVLFALGRNDEALAAYEIGLAPIQKAFASGEPVEPVHAVAFTNLGAIHTQGRRWPQAFDAFDKALRLEPKRTDLLASRGFVAFQQGKLDVAAADYEKVLAADPKSSAAALHLGLIHARKDQCQQAVARLEQGLPGFDVPTRIQALEPLAGCYARLGRAQDAENAFRAVLADRPDDAELLFALGRLQRKQGKAADAEELLAKAASRRPEHRDTTIELLALAEQRGDRDRQIALAEDLVKRHGAAVPALWQARFSLALLYLELGRPKDALPHLEALGAAKQVPAASKAEIVRTHGVALAAAGQYDDARKKLRAAGGAGAGNALAFVEAMAGQPEAALQAMGGKQQGSAQRANLGLLLWSLGRFDDARPHLEAGGSEPAVRAALGDLALRRGDLGEAMEQWQAVAAGCARGADPRAAKLCAWVKKAQDQARLQAAFGDLARALRGEGGGVTGLRQVADDALAATPAGDPRRAQVLYLRGMARLQGGELDGAVADLGAALEAKPAPELEAVLRNNLAVAHARAGRTAEARRHFESARAHGGSGNSSSGSGAVAALNLAILLDGEGRKAEALPLYLQYVQADGPRRKEIEGWVARLREVTP
jgi:tetratricopeptide (TPR) repeat protein